MHLIYIKSKWNKGSGDLGARSNKAKFPTCEKEELKKLKKSLAPGVVEHTFPAVGRQGLVDF